jgi:two-component system, LytTR family, response regulator
MIKAIIVDDEEKSRDFLETQLRNNCSGVKTMEKCECIESAQRAIAIHNPDLVFLDIEMPFENGFSLFDKIKNPDFEVIFTTAYNQHALRAIKLSALDYLLKPIDSDDLVKAVEKFEKRKDKKPDLKQGLELLLSNLNHKNKQARISVPTFDGLQMLNTEDIIKCVANESYTEIILVGGTRLMVSRILKEYEELLSELNFFRIHNSCLVNLKHVKKYVKGEGGYVLMSDGETCEVSRRKKSELLDRLSMVEF